MKRLIFLLLILCSCAHNDKREDINCKYQGAVVYHVYNNELFGHPVYSLKYKGEITLFVHAFDIDKGYKVGDTINKPCIK